MQQLNARDLSYLLDMLRCCRDVMEFTSTVTYEEFERDKMRRYATERQLETLGEAANHVSARVQTFLPAVEWHRIIGLRNKLAHDYGEILAQRVWLIATDNVPRLRSQLESIEQLRQAMEGQDRG
jgi:uncharacterized protein with HEPN domain